MATPTNHWKLGLFVVTGVVATLAALLSFGAWRLRQETVAYKTYFDESVQGLEVGAPVKYRGVTIGTVSDIDIAPDRRHVLVTSSLTVKELSRLHLVTPSGRKTTRLGVPPDLRAQLASSGLTGVKFLQIDFFDVKTNPPPVLPFPVEENYIPAAVSTMKNVEDAIVAAVDRFPIIADQLLEVMKRVSAILEEVDAKKLPDQTTALLAHANEVLTSLDRSLKKIDPGKLSKNAQETIESANAAIGKLSNLIDRVGGDKGLVTSAQRATDAMGDMVHGASVVGPELQDALRGIQEASESITRLADALERDPDMLIKGRRRKVVR